MQFTFLNAGNVHFEVDEQLLAQVKNKVFGANVGVSVKSYLDSYKNQILAMPVEINYVAVHNGSVISVARSLNSAFFRFESELALRMGPTEEASTMLRKCIELAEAASYGIFSQLCAENGVPQSSMELTPHEKYDTAISDFLKHIELPIE